MSLLTSNFSKKRMIYQLVHLIVYEIKQRHENRFVTRLFAFQLIFVVVLTNQKNISSIFCLFFKD